MRLLLTTLLLATSLHAAEIQGTVVAVSDGDTITVLTPAKKQHEFGHISDHRVSRRSKIGHGLKIFSAPFATKSRGHKLNGIMGYQRQTGGTDGGTKWFLVNGKPIKINWLR